MRTRNLFLLLLAFMGLLWYLAGRNQHTVPAFDRPNDPWVFRSVLDKQPRMITFALNDKMWAAYSTDSCSLYKIWSGSVDFSGAVYNMRHGPQPLSVGNSWFENKHRQPWRVIAGGTEQSPKTDYKGHRYTRDGHAEIMYDLVLADGRRIRINERPEYVDRDGQAGFERTFTVENCPADVQVLMKTNVASIVDVSNVKTEGGSLKITDKKTAQSGDITVTTLEGDFALANSGSSSLRAMFVNVPQVENPFKVENEDEGTAGETTVHHPGEKIMAKSDCRTCHNPEVKTVGPAYVDIARKYKAIPANIDKLAQKVINGGAGVWGIAAMSAHPNVSLEEAKTMVGYVLSLDEGDDDGEGAATATTDIKSIPDEKWLKNDANVADRDLRPGLLVNIYQLNKNLSTLNEIPFSGKPDLTAIIGEVNAGAADFSPFADNFAALATGYLYLPKDESMVFQLSSDDGSRLFIDGKMLIDHDGPHGMEPKEAEVALRAGHHAVRIEYFQGGGGKGIMLKWARAGDPEMTFISASNWSHKTAGGEDAMAQLGGNKNPIPGDGAILKAVHPSYTVTQARPNEFLPKVAGMDFLPDGRLVVSTWDAMGGVYILSNVKSGDPKKIKVKRFASGLAEPLGLKVVDGQIYVLQKQELTRLEDTNGDDVADVYHCFAKGWKASANFHEFAFGLVYKPEDDAFYAALATAIMPGGASARPQIPDRGKVVKISRKDGSIEFVARGLRTPDGIGIGPDNQIFIADNQGDWLPSSKILHLKPGAFFGSFSVDSATVAALPVQQPVVWLPQDEIGNSPTQPILLDEGPYRNQLLHGDVYYGGLQRVFMEKVNDNYQGAVFRFTQGLEGGTHRIVRGPDGAFYIGMIGNPGNWGQDNKLWYGLQRMKYNGESAFEMLAVRAKTNGVEIEFTEPLRDGDGWATNHYNIEQWYYQPTKEYGGPKMDQHNLTVKSASVSADRKKVFLEIPGIKPGYVVHIHLKDLPISELGHEIWTTESWYTMNAIPQNAPGDILPPPPPSAPLADNTLTEKEKAAGWQLLFDGKSIAGFHNWGKTSIGTSWVINDNAIHLNAQPNPSGHWQAADGGDIITNDEYQDFELELDWKIGPCGNSGIIYNIVEDTKNYQYVWQTGPEMQVLDNTCHPDSRIVKHRAGDLYDLISCSYEMVKPAGQWNHVRLVSRNGKVEHWLNNRKLVEVQMFNDAWWKLIAGSKFKEMPAFGRSKKGKIAFQDHGDPVWYKNIKIRKN